MPSGKSTKLLLVALAALILIAPAASQTIDSVNEDRVVWLNSQTSFQELEVSCQNESTDISSVEINNTEIYSGASESVVLNTSDFQNPKYGFEPGKDKRVELYCSPGDNPDVSLEIDFAELKIEAEDLEKKGKVFVGEVMKSESGGLGNKQDIVIHYDFGGVSRFGLGAFNLSLTNGLQLNSDEVEGEGMTVNKENEKLILNPFVSSYPTNGEESDLVIKKQGHFKRSYSLADYFDENAFEVYEWRAERVGSNPGLEMDYDSVADGDYSFLFDMKYRDLSGLPERIRDSLTSRNFRLKVERDESEETDVSNDFETVEIGDDEELKNLPIMKAENPGDSSDANYRVFVNEYSQLDELNAGKYKFILEVEYSDRNGVTEEFKLDETIVDKTAEFSGVVLNSGGSGVVTEMVLRDEEMDRKQNLVTDGTGRYSTQIEKSSNSFEVKSKFYETSGDTASVPDGEVMLSGVRLEDSDLGPGGSAVKFDYLESPDTGIEGLQPVNLMMVKFGYPVEEIDQVEMAFDPGKVDPKDMKVFECDAWNFAAQECMTDWGDALPEDDVTVNPATWTINLDGTELYSIEGDKILMNAYVVGRNSEIMLQNDLNVKTRVKSGEEFTASGVLVDDSGDRVEDANVSLSVIGTDVEWSETTDSTGTFDFSRELNLQPGNYQLNLEAEKSPYERLDVESNATIEVYYERGMSLSAEGDQTIETGREEELSYTLENTGQSEIKDLEISVSGLEGYDHSVQPESIEGLGVEESGTVTVNFQLPEDILSPPVIDVTASGTSDGEEIDASASTTTFVSRNADEDQTQQTGNESNSSNNTSGQDSGFSVPGTQNAARMTGNFVSGQSDVNLVLGLILVFGMALAVAVKKKDSSSDRDVRTGRGRVQRPNVSPSIPGSEDSDQNDQSEDEDMEEEEKSDDEDSENDSDSESVECDVCGEEFEKETELKLHRQALH
jgi:hypothetical protein